MSDTLASLLASTSANDDTRKWLSHIIETLFNVKNIEEEEDD